METEDNQLEGTAQLAPVGENMHSADLLPSDYIPFFSDQPEDNNGDQNMNDVSAVPDAAAPAATGGTQSGAKRRKKKKKKKKPNAAPADGAPSAPAIGKPSSTAIVAPTLATSAGAPKAAVGTRVEAAAGVPVVAVAVAAAAAGAQKQGAAATSGPTLTKNKKRKIKKKLRIKLLKASGVQVPPSPAELRKRKLKKKRRKERLKSVGQIAAAQAETQPSDVPMEESSKDLDKDELQVDQVTKEAGGDSVVLAAEPADGLAERQQPVAAGLARGHTAALELQRPGEGATDRAAEHLAGR
ncbi:uncharacterized protein LOC133347577 [Lethenteron reissneri]|uniref:uncharacterized protein LOC133347577 n=1 Tax=Lethenteron reissneri TaxID=7753 RepID=UPI002AB77F0C|nr:uncharacterized protein LOC133347577 [Lethenteron reissneri]